MCWRQKAGKGELNYPLGVGAPGADPVGGCNEVWHEDFVRRADGDNPALIEKNEFVAVSRCQV